MIATTGNAARSVIAGGGAVGAAWWARRRALGWGATQAERVTTLPGDEFVRVAHLTATRAVTVAAAPARVWPWVAQIGQGRGGFYSYDGIENLLGMDIHSADQIVPKWQDIQVGDAVYLAAQVALTAVVVDPGRALVLRGAVPVGRAAPPYDFTWAFVLLDGPAGTTRLVVRERYAYLTWWAPLVVEPVQVASRIMTAGMLRGISARACRNRQPALPGADAPSAT